MGDINKRQNFISVDGKTVRNSYGDFFTVGDLVEHQDNSVGSATIISFECEVENNEIKVNTNKGHVHIDFILNLTSDVVDANALIEYIEDVKEQLYCNASDEYKNNHITYLYSNDQIETHLDYFVKSMRTGLSGYKSLLFFDDYLSEYNEKNK